MSDLLQLSDPWWHFPLRAVLIYVMVLVLMRMSGKRAVGQFTPFDLVLLILIGNAVQNGLNGGDDSITGAAILAGCLIALNYAFALATARSSSIRHLVEGKPIKLAENGQIFRDILRRELVSNADFEKSMREAGCGDLDNIESAMLETDGRITLMTRSGKGDST